MILTISRAGDQVLIHICTASSERPRDEDTATSKLVWKIADDMMLDLL